MKIMTPEEIFKGQEIHHVSGEDLMKESDKCKTHELQLSKDGVYKFVTYIPK